MQAGHSDDHNPFFKWCGCLFGEDLKFLFRWMLLECESYIQKQPPEVFYKKGAFWHIVKFVGNHPCQSLFFNKVASWDLQFFLNIGSSIGVLLRISRIYRCFPRTSVFLYKTSGPLLRYGCPQKRTLGSEKIFSNWNSFKNDDEKLVRFSRYSSFCLDFLGMYQNGLIKKIRLISNFMRSQPDKQTIVIHILTNILRSKSNQTMKFGLLIECNMRNIYLEKSCRKCRWETCPRPFPKK